MAIVKMKKFKLFALEKDRKPLLKELQKFDYVHFVKTTNKENEDLKEIQIPENINLFKEKSQIEFDMAHYLSGYNGKCSNIHGHRYKLIVSVKSETLHQEGQLRGMVDDFGNIKARLKEIEDLYDHKLVIEDNEDGRLVAQKLSELPNAFKVMLVPYRPTAEEMSRDIFYKLKDMGLNVSEVELFETPTNSCTYSED